MRLKIIAITCCWLALALTSAGPSALALDARPHAQSSWTLMIYCDADNSLETPQIANVKEMMQYGSTDQVQIVLLCDRSPKSEPKDQYTDEAIGGLPDWHGAKLLHVEKGALRQMADWGDTNVADPATLRKFLDAGATAYPAQHYGLIVEDHGSGWQAFCVDETHGDKMMSLRSLRAALEPFVAAHGKLEMVGLDACLMGSFETAQALAPVANYMVASEELAPSRGWNYDRLTHDLGEKPLMNGYDLGKAIIDAYLLHFNKSKDQVAKFESLRVTLSMVDLNRFEPLSKAVLELGDSCESSLKHGRDGWLRVARARIQSEEYGSDGLGGEGHDEEMHDLVGIARALEHCGDDVIEAAATKVDLAVRTAVRCAIHGPCTSRSEGLSIFFPTVGIVVEDALGYDYLAKTFAGECHWVNFIGMYSYSVHNFGKEPGLKPLIVSGNKVTYESPATLITKCEDNDIDKAYEVIFARDHDSLLVIGRKPTNVGKDGSIGAKFDGTWWLLAAKEKLIMCPISTFDTIDDDHSLAYVPVKLQREGSKEWIDVMITFLITFKPNLGTFPVFAFSTTKEGPLQIVFKSGDSIRPVYDRIGADGHITEFPSPENVALHLKDPADLTLEFGTMGKGSYKVGFEVTNIAGHSSFIDTDFDFE